MYLIRFAIFVFSMPFMMFISCVDKKEVEFNEDDYYKTQGVVVKVYRGFYSRYVLSSKSNYMYKLNLSPPLLGVADSELVLHVNEPVVVYVSKKDSLDSFVGYRGLIDEKLFNRFMKELEVVSEKKAR